MNNSVHIFINKKCIFISFKYRDMYRIVTQVSWYGS
jgi:tRNA U54 and U55 pseudouridine synthase Pus10